MRITDICDKLRAELYNNGYEYGFLKDSKRITSDKSKGFDEAFAHSLLTDYRIQYPADTKREKVGICLDVVLVMKEMLDAMNIKSYIFMLFQKERNKVHAIIAFCAEDRIVYLDLPRSPVKLTTVRKLSLIMRSS